MRRPDAAWRIRFALNRAAQQIMSSRRATATEKIIMTTLGLFTKLIVSDEKAQADYYGKVYDLNAIYHVEGVSDGEPFREIILSPGTDMSAGTLVMFNFTERAAPRDQQVILGFTTDDLDALVERIKANGGKLNGPVREETEHGVRVVFSVDPEGVLCENVQMLGQH